MVQSGLTHEVLASFGYSPEGHALHLFPRTLLYCPSVHATHVSPTMCLPSSHLTLLEGKKSVAMEK